MHQKRRKNMYVKNFMLLLIKMLEFIVAAMLKWCK